MDIKQLITEDQRVDTGKYKDNQEIWRAINTSRELWKIMETGEYQTTKHQYFLDNIDPEYEYMLFNIPKNIAINRWRTSNYHIYE